MPLWISRLLRRRPKPTPPRSDTPGKREADSALSRAVEANRQLDAYQPAVARLAARLAREREINHFAELFRHALEGGHN